MTRGREQGTIFSYNLLITQNNWYNWPIKNKITNSEIAVFTIPPLTNFFLLFSNLWDLFLSQERLKSLRRIQFPEAAIDCSVFCVTDACPCFKRSRLPITSRLGPTDLLETPLDATFVQCTYIDPTCMYMLNLGGAIFRELRLTSDKQIERENYCRINITLCLYTNMRNFLLC